MIRVVVRRGAGDRPAEGIVEPLLSGSEAAAKERGRIELDTHGSQRERVQVEIDPMPGLRPNMLVEVLEIGRRPWRGIIDSINIEVVASTDDEGGLVIARSMRLEIEREEI